MRRRFRLSATRCAGAALGGATLIAFFLLPFYPAQGGGTLTLFQTLLTIYTSRAGLMALGANTASPFVVVMAAAILVMISGFSGYFPLGSAVSGASGMLIMTILPFLANSGFDPRFAASGAGFWMIWVTTAVMFVPAAKLSRRERTVRERELLVVQPVLLPEGSELSEDVVAALRSAPSLTDLLLPCPKCGSRNLNSAKYCMECGSALVTAKPA